MTTCLPVIALAMGDPAGISPELTAKLLALDEVRAVARIAVFGDRRVLDQGAEVAALKLDIAHVRPGEAFDASARPVFIDLGHLDPATVKRCEATPVEVITAWKANATSQATPTCRAKTAAA